MASKAITELRLYRDDRFIVSLPGYESLNYGEQVNAFVDMEFEYDVSKYDSNKEDLVLLVENLVVGSEVRVFRQAVGEEALKLVYSGEVQETEKEVTSDGRNKLKVSVEHYGNVFLKRRSITITHINKEESQIAWDNIDETQTNQLGVFTLDQVSCGISQGTLQTTGNTRTRQYDEDEVLKIEKQLADVKDIVSNPLGSPDRIRGFTITPDLIDPSYRSFSWYGDYGVRRDITYTSNLIDSINETISIKDFATRVIAKGKNGITAIANSTDQEILDFFKVREVYVSKTNVETLGELQEQAEEELAKRQKAIRTVSFSIVKNDPYIGKYRAGDIIKVRFDNGFVTVAGEEFKVYAINISVDDKGVETSKLIVSQEKPITLRSALEDKVIGRLLRTERERIDELEK